MKRVAIATAVVMILAVVPTTAANHFSVGGQDAIGYGADETPDNPSVEGVDTATRDTPFGVGTLTEDQCADINESELSQEEFEKARASDAFCNKLIYHEGSPYEQTSTPDQDFNGPIEVFDVVRSQRPMFGVGTCLPTWCTTLPGGEIAFEAIHDAGSVAGLTENGSEANKKGGDNFQEYNFPSFASASYIVQQETNTWRMNGWANPTAMLETFYGFLEDENGPISDVQLEQIVADNSEKFDSDRTTKAAVCGFTADSEISIAATDTGMCEILFEYVEPQPDDRDNFRDGYNNQCKSPTYVCGAFSPGWDAILNCAGASPCADSGSAVDQFDYTRFHWVVAPTQSECTGSQEPGFAFETGTDWPYLAHDLDVWSSAQDVRDVENTEGAENARSYAVQQAANAVNDALDTAFENISSVSENASDVYGPVLENATDEVNNLTDEVPGLPPIPEAPTQVPDTSKGDRVEPNMYMGNFSTLTEDSQQLHQLDRVSEEGEVDPCTEFFDGGVDAEDPVDPWVNYVDTETFWQDFVALGLNSPSLYGNNDADHQDDMNAPTEGFVYFQGQVGMFTDKNDNGWYDQAGNENLFNNIEDAGAYPLFWDMHVDSKGEIDEEAGCDLGFGNQLTSEMKLANYGPHTGLVHAIYLKEASAVLDSSGVDTIPFPDGETIFVLESQSMTALRNQGDTDVTSWIDGIVDDLKDTVVTGDVEPDVVYVNDMLARDNSYTRQCVEDTGGFGTQVSLFHNCETSCEGDTIVTGYMIESTDPNGVIGASDGSISALEVQGETFSLENPIETWIDVDPFDNNPDRNRHASSAPN